MKQRSGMPYDVVAFSTDEKAVLWTLEEEGAFHRLLRHAWVNGSLPDDLAALAQICRCDVDQMKKMWVRLEASWPVDGRNGRRYNRKQESERKYLKAKAEAGALGGSKPKANRKQNPQVCLPSASSKTQAPIPSPSHLNQTKKEEESPKPPSVPKADLPRDAAMDMFSEGYRRKFKTEYPITAGDATQLSSIRRVNRIDARAAPDGWESAVKNYFETPQKNYTLRDLACRFGVFKNSALDGYGKPLNGIAARASPSRPSDEEIERERQLQFGGLKRIQ